MLYLLVLVFIAGLTVAAYIQDAKDPQVRDQLARQAKKRRIFWQSHFSPNDC